MKPNVFRAVTCRQFLKTSGEVGAAAAIFSIAKRSWAGSPNEKVLLGVMGVSGRGTQLARQLAGLPGAEVAYVCDVDKRNVGKAIESVTAQQKRAPQGIEDFRRILDDPAIDGLVIAAPDHWHTPAAILACQAGKHVYVEKPCTHNAQEGEWLAAAARKHDRRVQHGTQRRSWPSLQEAISKLHDGVIGKVLSARCWYFNDRPSIGRGRNVPVPDWLNWDLWQGPAPQRDYHDNIVHYNWHWFWHWGTGEVGNNGVHFIDLARWGLGVDGPQRVTSGGGRYRYDDDQETPDTNLATFDFEGCTLAWEGRSWGGRRADSPPADVVFHGEKGTLAIQGSNYKVYDGAGRELEQGSGAGDDPGHLQNFLDAIRGDAKLNAEINEGIRSALLCHLANIAYRTGQTVHFDPETSRIKGAGATSELWGREYRKDWEPKI